MTKPYKRVPIGSHGDGIVFNAGQNDEAFLLENTIVLQNGESKVTGIVNFLAKETNSSPGFCRLQLLPGLNFQNNIYTEENGVKFLSSEKFIHMCLELSRRNSSAESPFIVTNALRLDYCLPFKTWPDCAEEWLYRERPRCWPSAALVSKIKDTTCYCEPIENGQSLHPNLEWRISFAVAETLLIRSMGDTIFKLYQILKILAREKINTEIGCQNIVSSYVIRTTLYWVCENGLPNIISESNFEFCLLFFINQLEKWIKDDFCPHYFIPERNIFEASVSPHSKACLLECLSDIKSDIFSAVLELPSFERLKLAHEEGTVITLPSLEDIKLWKEISVFNYASGISYCVLHSRYAFEILENMETTFAANSQKFSEMQLAFLKVLYYPLAKATGTILYNSVVKISHNKSMYCGLRLSKRLSILGTKCDVISGRLSLATFHYLCGQYKLCIGLTDSVLRGIQPFTVYNRKDYGIIQGDGRLEAYSEVILNASIPLNKKMQRAFLNDFEIFKEGPVIPSHLCLEIEFFLDPPASSFLPALVYIHFLRFLSFHEMNNESEMRSSLLVLRTISYDDEHGGNLYIASNMIGICEMMSGNIQMAIKYFGQAALSLKRANILYHKNTGLLRIALLLNSRVNM
ncbi:uncharacterized protein LOC133192820 [Saccostrea echinata]|uniref:uncharacterized protein LOC133192820 n=1 Tax=Saccostrea echinata TaxID=191078 RepID=UPI002A81BA44|nr:uncharacterized protein LOC133192820 [Saccostrea echinata]